MEAGEDEIKESVNEKKIRKVYYKTRVELDKKGNIIGTGRKTTMKITSNSVEREGETSVSKKS